MKLAVIGGCGHVGLPLSIALADANPSWHVTIYDINADTVASLKQGQMPFNEPGAQEKLDKALAHNLDVTTSPECLTPCDILITIIGTPVDEHLNPLYGQFIEQMKTLLPYFRDGQTLILRSTVFPGTSERVKQLFEREGLDIHISFCPERVAEGKAMIELYSLPQIISGFDDTALANAKEVFGSIANELLEVSPLEAELAKLFTNSWRYLQFAASNQFYMLAENAGQDFYRIHHAVTHNYPRAKGFPRAGFAAGPCLFKDTMQLSSFSGNTFFLGHAAMLVNEGMPYFLISQLKKEFDLRTKTVGILGMAFKGESDDKRSSLSYKLKKLLQMETFDVLCTDEYIEDDSFLSLDDTMAQADILIVAAPHRRYQSIRTEKVIVDMWDWLPK